MPDTFLFPLNSFHFPSDFHVYFGLCLLFVCLRRKLWAKCKGKELLRDLGSPFGVLASVTPSGSPHRGEQPQSWGARCVCVSPGGEKHTGGGRESGSDAWKQYMRRSTW